MNIEKPINNNYCATVVEVKTLVPLDNCDNVVGFPVFGFQAIVSKDTPIGTLGIVFPTETQLSDEFCANNNLYRHADRNVDQSKKGYIEDNRRIRAIKFRGQTSNCFFVPLESLRWTRAKIENLQVGDEFDILNGKEICKKYVVAVREGRSNSQSGQKKVSRVDAKHMPEHFDTDNFFKWSDGLDQTSQVVVTQKLHGTSIRVGNTMVKRKLGIKDKIGRALGVKVEEYEYDYVFGSRKVIKDANNPDHKHFYETDIWTEFGKSLQGLLPENYLVFAELLGWTPDGKEIQKGYTYGIPCRSAEMYIYRIAIVNRDGHVTDLSWSQIKEFCTTRGLKHVPELWKGSLNDFKAIVGEFLDTRYFDVLHGGYRNALWLGENKDIVDEGVCVRIERMTPYIMKAKSPKFFEHETAILDTGVEDLESAQNV